MEATTLQKIKVYLHSIRPFFVNWSIRLVAENWILKVYYKSAFIDFNIKERIPMSDKQAFDTVKRFCFNAYCDYEWDWRTLSSREIWILLWVSSEVVRWMLSNIYKKIRLHGELLQEEQETELIHHRKQEPTGSLIQEKQSTGDTRETQERVERPLW